MADFEAALRQAAAAQGALLVAGCGFHLLQALLRWCRQHDITFDSDTWSAVEALVRNVAECPHRLVPATMATYLGYLDGFGHPQMAHVTHSLLLLLL